MIVLASRLHNLEIKKDSLSLRRPFDHRHDLPSRCDPVDVYEDIGERLCRVRRPPHVWVACPLLGPRWRRCSGRASLPCSRPEGCKLPPCAASKEPDRRARRVLVDDRDERLICSYNDPALDADATWLPIAWVVHVDVVLADVRWPGGAARLGSGARGGRSADAWARPYAPKSTPCCLLPRRAQRSSGKSRAEMPAQVREGARLFRSKLRKKLVVCCELLFPELAL